MRIYFSGSMSGDPNVTIVEYRTLEEAKGAVERFFNGLVSPTTKV